MDRPGRESVENERSAFALREVLRFREASKGTSVYKVPLASQSAIATPFFASLFGCRVAGLAIKRAALQRSASRMAPGFGGVYQVYHTRRNKSHLEITNM